MPASAPCESEGSKATDAGAVESVGVGFAAAGARPFVAGAGACLEGCGRGGGGGARGAGGGMGVECTGVGAMVPHALLLVLTDGTISFGSWNSLTGAHRVSICTFTPVNQVK